MDWKRHLEAEALLASKGIGGFTMYYRRERTDKFGVINFTLNYDQNRDYWSASYAVHNERPMKTRLIKLGAQPVLEAAGTIYSYPSQARAELAVRATLLRLRTGQHPDDVTS